MKKLNTVLTLLALFTLSFATFAEETYKIDPTHAQIGFAVTHLVISKVKGHFKEFDGSLTADDSGKLVKADATIKVASIDTGIKKRDDHLRSPDFFDAEKFPESRKLAQVDNLPTFAAFSGGALLNQVQTNKYEVLKTLVNEVASH